MWEQLGKLVPKKATGTLYDDLLFGSRNGTPRGKPYPSGEGRLALRTEAAKT
ncbi:MAG: hypothetical protein HYR63_15080 [Proteobacteria bacterium]|nr:hypothetical protein [Pseudomonadota bacterium]